MQVKIQNKIFDCLDASVQLSLGSHANIDLIFDLNSCDCYQQIVRIYEQKNEFQIESKSFSGKGCYIKTLDIDYNQNRMNIFVHCDLLNPVNLQIRREDSINDILTKTFNNKDDIK